MKIFKQFMLSFVVSIWSKVYIKSLLFSVREKWFYPFYILHVKCNFTSNHILPRRKSWQPTPVFLPGESHGQRNLTVHRIAQSDTTEAT